MRFLSAALTDSLPQTGRTSGFAVRVAGAAMTAFGEAAAAADMLGRLSVTDSVEKSKATRSKFSDVRPSNAAFHNQTPHSELTKTAGSKSDRLCFPLRHFLNAAPTPL